MKKIALLMVSMLFVVGCGDDESVSGPEVVTPPTSEATVSVAFPKDLLTENSATMVISWTGDVADFGYEVTLGDGSDSHFHEYIADGTYNERSEEFVDLHPDTTYIAKVYVVDGNGVRVRAQKTFTTKATVPPVVELAISNLRVEVHMNASGSVKIKELMFDLSKTATWEVMRWDLTVPTNPQLIQSGNGENQRGEVPLTTLVNGHNYKFRVTAYNVPGEVKFAEITINNWTSP